MTLKNFIPQPSALWAVLVERADDPLRFEPALDPVRLVIGWAEDEEGETRPVLGPSLKLGTGLELFEPSRAAADKLVKEFEKASRGEIRGHAVRQALERFEKRFGLSDS